MRVISKSRIREFWESPGRQDAEGPLRAWYTHVNHRSVTWQSWSDVKCDYPSASLVGSCVIFNIGGNKYRLVTRVLYASQKVFILKSMTHREYDNEKWKDECFEPPPTAEEKRAAKPRRLKPK